MIFRNTPMKFNYRNPCKVCAKRFTTDNVRERTCDICYKKYPSLKNKTTKKK